jgi:arabinogalactan endo-1,4-beta-galactosidase
MNKIILSTIFLLAFPWQSKAQEQLYVGGDISVLQSYEDHAVDYYDQQGTRIDDVLKYMKSEAVGWNALRVRLFVDPSGDSDPQVCQDIDYVVRLGKRIKAEGFSFMLDFHYSDTWADPGSQWTPKAWFGLDDTQLQAKVYEYTKDCLQKLVEAGAAPDFIQTGNEISYGMLWGQSGTTANRCYYNSDANWPRFIALLGQATKACREVCPQAKIIIHTERAGQTDVLVGIYNRLASVDYDIIGLSYYPFWHNGLSVLGSALKLLANKFPDKKVQIVETAYYYQWQPWIGNGIDYDYSSTWPITPDGQAAFAKDLIALLKGHSNVNGLYWWFPEENGNGPSSSVLKGWVNRGLWDNYTHCALPGLYVLKDFLGGSTAVSAINASKKNAGSWYTLQGVRLKGQPTLPGVYLHNGYKRINGLTN